MKNALRHISCIVIGLNVAGCGLADRLSQVGKPPVLSAIENPTTQPGYKPVQMPMPAPEPVYYNSNSLWQSGSRAFFRDQRARRVGDILTVKVKITDKASVDNKSKRTRTTSESAGIDNLLGFEDRIKKLLPAAADNTSLVKTNSKTSSEGDGSIDRAEDITTTVAAVVTQTLPNGNLVIEGRQEVRINFEVRELIVAGIVRPEDIGSDNTIDSTKIAEARIAYGGRGQITEVQQPRYGQQTMDILLPF